MTAQRYLETQDYKVQFEQCTVGIGCIISKDCLSFSAIADNHASALSRAIRYLQKFRKLQEGDGKSESY